MGILYRLGFLGLLGLLVLLIIYILRPNFQQRFVSSTFVWKQSLRYKKRRLPFNRFRDLLIIVCQILIISISAFALTYPFIKNSVAAPKTEKIVIIDASASMLAHQGDDITRFERAVSEVKTLGQQMLTQGQAITVILADNNARGIMVHETALDKFEAAMDRLTLPNESNLPSGCSFAQADIDGAMILAETYLKEIPMANVVLYTATKYENTGDVEVINVSKTDSKYGENKEWNAAILDITATYEENYYRFAIEVASFNYDTNFTVNLVAFDVNEEQTTLEAASNLIYCVDNKSVIVRFNNLNINQFSSIHVFINVPDSFEYDNHFYLYGCKKEEIKVVYVSPFPSNFYKGILASLSAAFASRWDIKFEMTSLYELEEQQKKLEGFDFYIIEHFMPEEMPGDGVVLLISPDETPPDFGITLGEIIDKSTAADEDTLYLVSGETSQIMSHINPKNIFVSRYREILSYESDYKPLMYSPNNGKEDDPVFLLKNTPGSKVAVITYASSFSDFSLSFEFPTLVFNLLNCLMPATVRRYVFDIGEPVVFDQSEAVLDETRPAITVDYGQNYGPSSETFYNSFPYTISAFLPGTYTVTQQLISERPVSETYFIKVAAAESNFVEPLTFEPPVFPPIPNYDLDIYVYLAAALLAVVFIERLLHMKKEI